jgi:UDP-4-amino-4,6-dideoxy-N-acetyl-beta-L-altrosamine transaminase
MQLTKSIPYGRQDINQADIEAVREVLTSDFLTQGKTVPAFEDSISSYCNAKHSIAVNSATSALHIACMALELGKDDILWSSPNTFVASTNCALYCGAKIDFVDIDSNTYNLSVDALKDKLIQAELLGTLPKIVVPVHFTGQPCDMMGIHELSLKYGFKIIEDASHAIGAKYNGEVIGNCRFSDITIFSFHPVKIITTGEGGMAVTNDPDLAFKMQRFRTHGITSESDRMVKQPDDEIWGYQQITLGYNYRMTDIQAALGLSQLKRLDEFVEKRHEIAARYDEELKDLPLVIPYQEKNGYSSYHLYVIRLKAFGYGISQQQVFQRMRSNGIDINLHYIPVYLQPHYQALGFRRGYCPEAESYFKETMSIPMYPGLTDNNQTKVILTLKEILR